MRRMLDLDTRDRSHRFPSTPRSPDGIDASRPKFTEPNFLGGSPESGRGPGGGESSDDAPCTFTRVPIAGEGGLFVALSRCGCVRARAIATCPEEALETVLREGRGQIGACDESLPELALVARERGLPLAALTAAQRETRALLAMLPGILVMVTERAVREADLTRYLRACAQTMEVAPWTTPMARTMFEVKVTNRGPATRYTLILQKDGGQYGPGFGLLHPDVSLRMNPENVVEVRGNAALIVALVDVPPVAVSAFEDAFGITQFPVALTLRCSPDPAPLVTEEIRLLTGVMECLFELSFEERASSEVDGQTITVTPHPDDALLGTPAGRA